MGKAVASASMTRFAGRDFLTLAEYKQQELHYLLALAKALKQEHHSGKKNQLLEGKVLGMIFEKASTRTRISFETAMYQMGGTAIYLRSEDIQISRGEAISDTGKVLSGYLDGIMIRTFSQAVVEELATYATIPVINGLTDMYHPCQVLADLLTIQEVKGTLNDITIAFIGDGNNMANSLLIGAAIMGMNINMATPAGYEPDSLIVQKALNVATGSKNWLEITNDPTVAAKQADIIYTDVWASMGQEKEQQKRQSDFANFQVDSELMALTKKDAIFMHCLPAHRGEEVSADVIDGNQSVVFQQAENRLHAQKALLAALLS